MAEEFIFHAEDFEDDEPSGGEDPGKKPEPPEPPAEFHFGEAAPEPLRGKTEAEALQVFAQLATMNQNLSTRLQNISQAPPAAPEPPAELPVFEPEDLDPSNKEAMHKKLTQFFESKAEPFVRETMQLKASQAYMIAMSDPLLNRFKSEVDSEVYGKSPQQVADPNFWVGLKSRIQERHFDTLAREHVEGNKRTTPQFVADSSNDSEGPRKDDKLSQDEKEMIAKLGVNPKAYLQTRKMMEGGA